MCLKHYSIMHPSLFDSAVFGDSKAVFCPRMLEPRKNHTPRDWILSCPWGTDAPSKGEGWSCLGGKPTPRPYPPPAPGPGPNIGYRCKGPAAQRRCIQGAGGGTHTQGATTCDGQCSALAADEWLASITGNWNVQRNSTPLPMATTLAKAAAVPFRRCSGWVYTLGEVWHGNDTGSAAIPKGSSPTEGFEFCSLACCQREGCDAWVTAPKDAGSPHAGQ